MNAIRVFSLSTLLATAGMAQSNFAGVWEFNPTQSKNVGMMSQMKLTATIKQTREDLIVSTATVFNGKDGTSETRFNLAGKPLTNSNPMEGPAETIAKWDGARLVVTWTSEGSVAGTKSVRTETRYLSPDGRLMTVESKRGAAPPVVMVYERK